MERAENADPCIVDHNSDLTQLAACLLHKLLHICRTGDVRNDRQGGDTLLVKRRGSSFQFIAVPGANGHGRSEQAKLPSDGAPYATASPGDQSLLSFECQA